MQRISVLSISVIGTKWDAENTLSIKITFLVKRYTAVVHSVFEKYIFALFSIKNSEANL